MDVVAVGGVSSGSEAYLAHLTGAKAVQVGSALIKEGVSAIGRIDQELDALLAKNGKASVAGSSARSPSRSRSFRQGPHISRGGCDIPRLAPEFARW